MWIEAGNWKLFAFLLSDNRTGDIFEVMESGVWLWEQVRDKANELTAVYFEQLTLLQVVSSCDWKKYQNPQKLFVAFCEFWAL